MTMKFKTLKEEQPTIKKESAFSKAAPQQVKNTNRKTINKYPQKSTKFTQQEIDLFKKYKERTGVSRNQLAKLAIIQAKKNNGQFNIKNREKGTIPTSVLLTQELSQYLKELAQNNLEKEGVMLRYLMIDYVENN